MVLNKVVISGVIGNGLEWFEYFLYAAFSTIFAKLFFPHSDPVVAQISVLTIFAAGFVMRPVGAIVFGIIGDKYGRKVSLSSSILLMAIPTGCIGLLPTYDTIGICAPIVLAIIRLLQGLSLGGEFSSCISFMIEHAPERKRGFIGSASFVSMCAGIALGSVVAYSLSYFLSPANFESWGWRLPFLFAMLIGFVGMYIRTQLTESPIYLASKEENNIAASPLKEIITDYWPELLIAIGVYLTVTVPFYTLTMYVTNFLIHTVKLPYQDAMFINIFAMLSCILILPLSAWVSDHYGRKPILFISTIILVLLAYPIFYLLGQPGILAPLISQIIFGVIAALYMGPIPALLVELFPTRLRSTGVGLSYNLSASIFGATTPLVFTTFIKYPNQSHYIALYLIIFAVFSMISLYYFKDKYNQALS